MSVALTLIVWILYILTVLISLLCFIVSVRALVDVIRRDPKMFAYSGKRTKRFWLIGCAVCLALSAMFTWQILSPLLQYGAPSFDQVSFFQIITAVFSGVYLADVKPAVS